MLDQSRLLELLVYGASVAQECVYEDRLRISYSC